MDDHPNSYTPLGTVIIGRNEGERLVQCLASVKNIGGRVIYVDSGSSDGSVAAARNSGALVVELDMTQPFTAARARNAGLAALGLHPNGKTDQTEIPEFIQFIDGDCEMNSGWFTAGINFLRAHPDVAIVSGRLRERHPDASIYNKLCDAEWDAPVGETHYCGGIAMMRTAALVKTNLFDARMIAGEEPELCLRILNSGWKIWRIADEMALHDADMMRFGQFWARMRRGGFAYALWADMHGKDPAKLGVGLMRRALIWGAIVPFVIVLAALFVGPLALMAFLVYPLQIIHFTVRGDGFSNATLLVLTKFAEAKGVLEFYWSKLRGRPAGLIEHK